MAHEDFIGKEYEAFTVEVEKGRLRLFAKAVGLTDAVHSDEAAAKAAGYDSLVAPPTLAYSLTLDAGQSFNILEDMGIDLPRAVHGGQSFTYHKPIIAGDVITGRQKVTNVYEKKGGALLFIEAETGLDNQRGERVCDLHSTIVVRQG